MISSQRVAHSPLLTFICTQCRDRQSSCNAGAVCDVLTHSCCFLFCFVRTCRTRDGWANGCDIQLRSRAVSFQYFATSIEHCQSNSRNRRAFSGGPPCNPSPALARIPTGDQCALLAAARPAWHQTRSVLPARAGTTARYIHHDDFSGAPGSSCGVGGIQVFCALAGLSEKLSAQRLSACWGSRAVGFCCSFFGVWCGLSSGLLGRTGLAPYASMDASSAAVYMPHEGNKLPRHSRWWISEDTLRFHIYQLAVELLHHVTRPLSISARCTVHNYFACRWHLLSTLLVWQEAWNMLQQPQVLKQHVVFGYSFNKSF